MIGVIIPYFQREPGLLNNALRSIQSQEGAHALLVYVVDDDSPSKVESELKGLDERLLSSVSVIKQDNAGPAAARNLGLEHLSDEVSIVAFLDSDDTWAAHHLNNMRRAFDAGAEFYFANFRHVESSESEFERCAFWPSGSPIDPSMPHLLWQDPGSLFQMLLTDSPVGTPSVAIKRSLLGSRRFKTAFRAAGEDTILWEELLETAPRTACSTDCDVLCGRGVNVFSHRSWGDLRTLRTITDLTLSRLYLCEHFKFNSSEMSKCERLLANSDLEFCRNVLAFTKRSKTLPVKSIATYVKCRPQAVLQFPEALRLAISARTRPRGY